MEFGLCTYCYTWAVGFEGHRPGKPMDAMGFLEKAAAYSVGLAQFSDNMDLTGFSDAQLSEIKRFASENNIEIQVGTRGFPAIPRYCEIATALGAKLVRAVIDDPDGRMTSGAIAAELEKLLPLLEVNGLVLALENHDHISSYTYADVLSETGSGNIRICLDTTNSIGIGEGIKETIGLLAPYVANVHIKDYCIYRPYHKLGLVVEGRPAGQGMLDIPALVKMFWGATAVLELWTAPEANDADTIAKEEQWVKESVSYIKSVIADIAGEAEGT
ncbi:MAG: sugar phosphate isomerase/epimerase [Clostridiales bacterium]|nr:sugar phosphate isomerase/epimerase [Clostridiales bacterium]